MTTAQHTATQQALALVAVSDAVKHLQQEHETRYHALEDRLNGVIQDADALVTGLHQDMANLILRYQALMRWLTKQFPTFDAEVQAELEAVVHETAETAQLAEAQNKEGPDEKSATHHV